MKMIDEMAVQVDPNRLTLNAAGKALGFAMEMANGNGNVTGYILGIDLAVIDPLNPSLKMILHTKSY